MRRRPLHRLAAIVATVCCLAVPAAGPGAMARPGREPLTPAAISERLASDHPDDRARAIGEIRSLLDAEPLVAALHLRSSWLRGLIEARESALVEEFAPRAIMAAAYDTASVEAMQRLRVQSLLRAGKAAEALAQAKALYCAGSMAGTEANMLLLAECLTAARPDSGDTERFKTEQVAGSRQSAPATAPASQAQLRSAVLDAIELDAQAYAPAIAALHVDGRSLPTAAGDLAAAGNLLLLSGRPEEARAFFERLRSIAATPLELRTGNEGVARCMRAADGTIGRANAFVAMLRAQAAKQP